MSIELLMEAATSAAEAVLFLKVGCGRGTPSHPYFSSSPLHRLLERAAELGMLTPLPGRVVKLRTCLYADDAMIFTNPLRQEINTLLLLLKEFGSATGLRINLEIFQ
jgi:hypothetical protein